MVFTLGNPGETYAHTRHNVGFDTLDIIAASFGLKLKRRCFRKYMQAVAMLPSGSQATFVKPLTYMNNSGAIAKYFIGKRFEVQQLIVVCDNLDLPVGSIRIRQGGSTAGHKGLISLAHHIGSTDFIRIYIGIGRPAQAATVVEHVLGSPDDNDERKALDKAIGNAADAVISLCDGTDIQEVMRAYNRRSKGN